MNFFESQDVARRNTKRLVIYFLLAVVSLIVITNLLVMALFGFLGDQGSSVNSIQDSFDWSTFTVISVGVLVVIVAGSLYKTAALSSGGAVVAESLGGRLINHETRDPNERKVLNVVEEMAIASGTPVPPVYLLENEEGINAFAAGFTPSDAAIGVTRGTINLLDREELQGVIAHEFSHILHGDMRLNIRLIGILHGILMIAMIGYFILRSGGGRSRSKENGAPVLLIGLGLMAVGYAGTFFGNLIKASVSREREFLADASAVQFTRNPGGISGALKKIGGYSNGSALNAADAPTMSHAYFANGVTSLLASVFATHPPLETRIKRVEPNWDGSYLEPDKSDAKSAQNRGSSKTETASEASTAQTASARREEFARAMTSVIVANEVIEAIGQTTPERLQRAQALIQQLPDAIKQEVHNPYGARAVIYCLVIDADHSVSQQQLQQLSAFADKGVYDLVLKLRESVSNIDIEFRLPLLEMAIPSLRQLTPKQYSLFQKNLECLILADQKVSMFEWALQKILTHHLEAEFGKRRNSAVKFSSLKQVQKPLETLLSALINQCAPTTKRQDATAAASRALELDALTLSSDEVDAKTLDSATDVLAAIKPTCKPQILSACFAAITADDEYSAEEMELMRAIAMTLDCPLPPIETRLANHPTS